MRSTRPPPSRLVTGPALLLTAAATTHCAADDKSGDPTPREEAISERSELVLKREVSRVAYQFLVTEYNESLSPREVQTAHVGGRNQVFFATPGSGSADMRNFLRSGGRTDGTVFAASNWITFQDHKNRNHHRASTCDGETHTHTYPTWADNEFTEVEITYACVPSDECGRDLLCAAKLAFDPTYCASAAR